MRPGRLDSHGPNGPQGPQPCGAVPVVPVPLSEALSVRRPRRVGRIGRYVCHRRCYRGCYRLLPAGLGQPLATPPHTAPLSLGLWNRRGDFVLRRCRPRWPRAATEESDVGDDERHHEVQGTSRIGGRGRGAVQERRALVESGEEQADDGGLSESAEDAHGAGSRGPPLAMRAARSRPLRPGRGSPSARPIGFP